jgi:hypothetical protein
MCKEHVPANPQLLKLCFFIVIGEPIRQHILELDNQKEKVQDKARPKKDKTCA